MNEVISSNATLRLTVRLIAVSTVLLFAAMLQANAQSAYTGDTGHYLQVPNGYAQPAQQTTGGRPIFGGQGMGQGQAMQPQASLQPLGASPTATAMPMQSAKASSVSPSLLPPEMASQSGAYTAAAAPMQQQPVTTMQPVLTPQPVAATTSNARIQAAATPSVSPQMLASMEPASGPAVVDSGINVQMRGQCGDGRPDNHRQAKGLSTSTTVFNDCFN